MSVEIFFCYAHEDEVLRQGLEKQLNALKRQGMIDIWHDREIHAGEEWKSEIDAHLKSADIILLLVSPDFMVSDYCYSVEMSSAIDRHNRKEARVIPVILRHVYWQKSPFGKLQVLPTDAIPVTDPLWHNLDKAFFNVSEGIREVIEEIEEMRKMEAIDLSLKTRWLTEEEREELSAITRETNEKLKKCKSPEEKEEVLLDFQLRTLPYADDPLFYHDDL
jgi:hypothetical protein